MRKANMWVEFVKELAKNNNIKYNEAVGKAKPYYDEYKKKMIGKGLIDTLKTGIKKGAKYAIDIAKTKGKEKMNELIDKGAETLTQSLEGGKMKKKMKGKGIIGDVLKYGKSAALNVVPLPGIIKDVANYAGDKVIEQSGLGFKKKKMNKNQSGAALYPSGFS